MHRWLKDNKHEVAITTLIALICILAGYVAGAEQVEARVGYGDLSVALGSYGDEGEEEGTPIPPQLDIREAIAAIYQRTEAMEQNVGFLLDYTHREMIRNVENQYSILKNSPDEAHREEVLKVLDDWKDIPPDMRGADLTMKYNYIFSWHERVLNDSAYLAQERNSLI